MQYSLSVILMYPGPAKKQMDKPIPLGQNWNCIVPAILVIKLKAGA